ncbi:GntR family transcriptional regulator [Paenibacillus sepulcri]
MRNKICLQVDHRLTFSVNTQIKEQLKWLIGTGQIETGDMLPAASQLAATLGLNRNTVNWVYTQLRDEGLVSMQKGKGTQVLDGAETEQLRKERAPMRQLLERAIKEAQAEGIKLHDLFVAGLAYSLLQNEQPSVARILFVECKGHAYTFYRREIEKATGREVQMVFLEDLLSGGLNAIEEAGQADIIVTTLNQAEEVKAVLAPFDKKVHVIGATAEPSVLLEISRLQPDMEVSFVCLGKKGGEWMARRVNDAGITGIKSAAFGLLDSEHLSEALDRSAKIYASEAVFPELKKMAPDKVELFPMRLEQSSENLLRELVGTDHSKHAAGVNP